MEISDNSFGASLRRWCTLPYCSTRITHNSSPAVVGCSRDANAFVCTNLLFPLWVWDNQYLIKKLIMNDLIRRSDRRNDLVRYIYVYAYVSIWMDWTVDTRISQLANDMYRNWWLVGRQKESTRSIGDSISLVFMTEYVSASSSLSRQTTARPIDLK